MGRIDGGAVVVRAGVRIATPEESDRPPAGVFAEQPEERRVEGDAEPSSAGGTEGYTDEGHQAEPLGGHEGNAEQRGRVRPPAFRKKEEGRVRTERASQFSRSHDHGTGRSVGGDRLGGAPRKVRFVPVPTKDVRGASIRNIGRTDTEAGRVDTSRDQQRCLVRIRPFPHAGVHRQRMDRGWVQLSRMRRGAADHPPRIHRIVHGGHTRRRATDLRSYGVPLRPRIFGGEFVGGESDH
mmetsp:Transcript_30087/g.89436  ORF Transcript_30087/g.89436 Transcript_30087/m.89436 type:complete len:238 (+) Transcript_30087:169-882(+)